MLEYWREAVLVLTGELQRLFSTNPAEVFFERQWLAIGVGIALIAAFIVKRLFFANKTHRAQSGYESSRGDQKGILVRAFNMIPKIVFSFAGVFILVAFAKPYVLSDYEEKSLDVRDICYLLDGSGSMTSRFGRTTKTISEVAWRAFFDFTALRTGQNDRSCYWMFGSNPYKVEHFTVDHELFRFQVYNSPWALSYPRQNKINEGAQYGKLNLPPDRFPVIYNSPGTNLVRALRALIEHFHDYGIPEAKKRALVLITDAEPNVFPKKELERLARERIVLYIIYIDAKDRPAGYYAGNQGTIPQLVRDVEKYGGKYFIITGSEPDTRALSDAFATINREIGTATIQNKVYSERVYIFQRFLAFAFVLTLGATLAGITIELKFGTNP